MGNNEQVAFFKSSLPGLIPPIEQVTDLIDKLRRLINPVTLNIQDRSDRYLILVMEMSLMELKRKIQYLNSPVTFEGNIIKNDDSGYYLNGERLEAGSMIEIHVLDEAENCWIFAEATIDYWSEDYYFVEYPAIPLRGTRARIRELTLNGVGSIG